MDNPLPIPWSVTDILEALALDTCGHPGYDGGLVFEGISTDSRSIRPGQLFVALAGETFDGHVFIPDMIQQGIQGFVINQNRLPAVLHGLAGQGRGDAPAVFPVADTLQALGDLARYQRRRSKVKLVAITGSNGKTSTREMTASIFSTRFRTLSSRGNYNNEIGLPLTLLNLSVEHEWAVVELGMNHPGEISRLGRIALPDIGVITNTAECHLEGLGTVTNVALAKAELMAAILPGGAAVLNLDDLRHEILGEAAGKNSSIEKVIWFGLNAGAAVRACNVRARDGRIAFTLIPESGEAIDITLNTPAPFMVNNALAASAAALHAGFDPADVKAGLEAFNPVSGRMVVKTLPNAIHLINDTYNANPGSMAGALETLTLLANGSPSAAVLGDMLELGPLSGDLHRKIGVTVVRTGVSRLYVYGEMGKQILEGALQAGFDRRYAMTGTKAEIIARLLTEIVPGSWILVKGSRGMRMEEIVMGLERGMASN